jgi:predicted Rossmann fold flavoprotein
VTMTPALVPIELRDDGTPGGHFAQWSGITLEARLALFNANGKELVAVTRSLLFTHFGLSGPAAMDISRHWLRARLERPEEEVRLCLGHPALPSPAVAEAWLVEQARAHPRRLIGEALRAWYPERIALALAEGFDTFATLTREGRAELAQRLTRLPLPAVKDRGYAFAETTAGGIDLREVDARTMASRVVPGLFLCGEMLDCDGRIGGFNFQWAWATGYLAGRGAAAE